MSSDSSDSEDEKDFNQDYAKAIAKKDTDKMRELHVNGIDVNKMAMYSKGKDKMTLLHYACLKKNFPAVKMLVKFKADVNLQAFPSGQTALHFAAEWSHPKIVKLLLDKGANPGTTNNKGKAPINVIGKKVKGTSKKVLGDKTDVQIMLLEATSNKAVEVQNEVDEDIASAQQGLRGLKDESNVRINIVQKRQGQKFDQMWPYMCCTNERYSVWTTENGTVDKYLSKRYIKVHIPVYKDKLTTHLDFSRIQQFQIALAKELLLKAGLRLKPETIPDKFQEKVIRKEKKKQKNKTKTTKPKKTKSKS